MKSDLEGKVEITRMLMNYCYMVRKGKNAAELAGFAAEREMQFKRELDRLEAELARTQTQELPLAVGQ